MNLKSRLVFMSMCGLLSLAGRSFGQLIIAENDQSELLPALEDTAKSQPKAAAVEFVQIPEPATYGWGAVAGLGVLLAIRRRSVRSADVAA